MRVVRLVCPLVWKVMLPQGTDARLERKVMHTAPLQPEPSSSGQRVRAHCFACVARLSSLTRSSVAGLWQHVTRRVAIQE